MSSELREDREVILDVLTHFFHSMLGKISEFDGSLKSEPDWSVYKFISECIDNSATRFGKVTKIRDSDQALEKFVEQVEGAIMLHGLKKVLLNPLLSLKSTLFQNKVGHASIYFEHLREIASDITWRWYFEGESSDVEDVSALQIPISIYAGTERKIYTISSTDSNNPRIVFQFNPADFTFEFFVNFTVYLVHEYVSHIFRQQFFGGSFTASSPIFEEGWLYFIAVQVVWKSKIRDLSLIDNDEYVTWYIGKLEQEAEAYAGDIGDGYKVAKKLMLILGEENFYLISKMIARCPSGNKGNKNFHSDFVLSIQQSIKNPGYENRKLKQTLADGLQEAGKILFDRGRYEDGHKSLELAAKIYPELEDMLLSTLGDLYLHSGNLDDAHDAYITALAKNERNWASLLGESMIQSRRGNTEQALKLVEGALALYPDQTQLLNQKSFILMQIGEIEQALKVTNSVLRFDSHNLIALRNKAAILNALGDFKEAKEVRDLIETIELRMYSESK